MPQRDSERLADRVLAAFRPWVVQLLDESLAARDEPGGDGLTEAERARSERGWSRFRRNRPTQRIYQGGLDCANKGR